MQAPDPQKIPLAHSGPINDELLEHVISAARDAQTSQINHNDGTLLIMCAAQLLEELLARRKAMELIGDLTNSENVILLHPGETS